MQKALGEGDAVSSFTADDRSGISTDLTGLSKTVRTSGSDLANLFKRFVDEFETSQAASTRTEKEVKQQEELISEAEKGKMKDLSGGTSLRERAAPTRVRPSFSLTRQELSVKWPGLPLECVRHVI